MHVEVKGLFTLEWLFLYFQRLHKSFKENQYPERTAKESLAQELGLTFQQVGNLFLALLLWWTHLSSLPWLWVNHSFFPYRLTNGLAILVGGSDIHHVRRPVQVVMLHSRPMTVELKIKEIMLRSRPVKAELKIKEIGVILRSKPLTAEVKTKERRSIN